MSKFKVGDKVLFGNQVVEITQIFDSGKCMVSNGWLQNSAWIDDLELYKTPHERLVELGFIEQEPFLGDYRLYKKGTFINIVIIIFNIKDRDYVIWKQDDEVSIEEFYPVNLELAEVLVDYLKELKE